MLPSRLFSETVQLAADSHILVLNSAANAFVLQAAQQLASGTITLAEDNIAVLAILEDAVHAFRHVPFHEYTLCEPPATMDIALLDLLYQPNNAWIRHALSVAAYALQPGGTLYVVGAKDRGILSVGKRVQEIFGNLETLSIQKGHRVLAAHKDAAIPLVTPSNLLDVAFPAIFAEGKLDEGTRLLLEALEVRETDEALDIGSGAGYLGLHIAKLATRGDVTMVDASLAAVAVARRAVEQSGLTNVTCLARQRRTGRALAALRSRRNQSSVPSGRHTDHRNCRTLHPRSRPGAAPTWPLLSRCEPFPQVRANAASALQNC